MLLITIPQLGGWIEPDEIRAWARIPWAILAMVGVISIFFLWFGMWGYWVKVDDSRKPVRRFWFLVLLVGFWFGAFLYYYGAYLPQVFRKWKAVD